MYVVAGELVAEVPDDRKVVATAGWNTRAHLKTVQARAAEATAPYYESTRAGFVAPEAAAVADTERDPAGFELRRRWLEYGE